MQRLNGWTWIGLVLAWGYHLLNRPMRWLPYASDAVYPWYVLHQTITVVVGFWLAKLPLGPWLEPALVIAATVLGCALLHEYVVRRVAWLRPLFGLREMAKPAVATEAGLLPRPTLPASD